MREPRRCGLGLLWELMGEAVWEQEDLEAVRSIPITQRLLYGDALSKGFLAPVTSSAGRLFDAVASLAGVRQVASFEGQGAMELEYVLYHPATAGAYPFTITGEGIVDWEPGIRALLEDVRRGGEVSKVSGRFHNLLAEAITALAGQNGEEVVLLSGGCFQNGWLTERTVHLLQLAGHRPLWHRRVPPNDGGLALGQLVALEQKE